LTRDSSVLAESPGVGRVYDCGECDGIHLQVGAVMLTLSREGYLRFAEMVIRSAANFELVMEQRDAE